VGQAWSNPWGARGQPWMKLRHGQDSRSPISAETVHALCVCYALAGAPADTVEAKLWVVEEHMRLVSAQALKAQHRVLLA
jgi:hypothetical protein